MTLNEVVRDNGIPFRVLRCLRDAKRIVRMNGSLFEVVGTCAGNLIARLDQIQFGCPFDGRTTIIDAEFAVDTLGV